MARNAVINYVIIIANTHVLHIFLDLKTHLLFFEASYTDLPLTLQKFSRIAH